MGIKVKFEIFPYLVQGRAQGEGEAPPKPKDCLENGVIFQSYMTKVLEDGIEN